MSASEASSGFSVSQLTVGLLDGFLAAAELHMGLDNPRGIQLTRPEPLQAWLALKSASALMDQYAPIMSDDVRIPFGARLSALLQRFERLAPEEPVRPRMAPVTSLHAVAEEALKEMKSATPARPEAAGPTRTPTGPLIPGTGLPKRGSGLLFPPRGR